MPQLFLIRSGSDLGVAVGEARRARGISQGQFAEDMSVDQAYLARLEDGYSIQLLDRVVRALRAFGAGIAVSIPDPRDAH